MQEKLLGSLKTLECAEKKGCGMKGKVGYDGLGCTRYPAGRKRLSQIRKDSKAKSKDL